MLPFIKESENCINSVVNMGKGKEKKYYIPLIDEGEDDDHVDIGENDQPFEIEMEDPQKKAEREESMRDDRRRMMLLTASGRLSLQEGPTPYSTRLLTTSVRRLVQSQSALVSGAAQGAKHAKGAVGKIGSSSRNLLSGTTESQRRLMKKTKDRDSFELAVEEAKQSSDNESSWKPRHSINVDEFEDDPNEPNKPNSDDDSSVSTCDLTEEERDRRDMEKVVRFARRVSADHRTIALEVRSSSKR